MKLRRKLGEPAVVHTVPGAGAGREPVELRHAQRQDGGAVMPLDGVVVCRRAASSTNGAVGAADNADPGLGEEWSRTARQYAAFGA